MNFKINKNHNSRGFTLIELLVVVAIIGILSSIVLASLNKARIKGADAARISDVQSLKTAIEMYYNDNGGYPTSNGAANGDVVMSDATITGKLVPTYIGSMPALLIADGDHYYAGGVTSGVSNAGYNLLIYIANTNSWCVSGSRGTSGGDWGIATACNF